MVAKLIALSVEELLHLEIPPRDWHIEGLLPVGSLAILSAREKSGKGLLGIDMAASVAEGRPVMGLETRQGTAVYLAAEEAIDELQVRVRQRLGESPTSPFFLVHLDGSTEGRLDLSKDHDAALLEEFIVDQRVEFLVPDVLRELHTAMEDSSDDMGPVMRRLRVIAHNQRCTIVVTHHDSKGGGGRGSTAIAGGADVVMQMATDTGSSTLEGTLTTRGRGVPPLELAIRYGEGASWEGSVSKGTMPKNKLTAADQIVQLLLEEPCPIAANGIAIKTQLKRSTVGNVMTDLKKSYPTFLTETVGSGTGSPSLYEVDPDHIPPRFAYLCG